MSESEALESPGLVLDLEDDAGASEGEECILDCGLGVRLAPTNTQKFSKMVVAAVRKFGGRRARDLDDLKPERRIEALFWVAAGATFLGFFDPASREPKFTVRVRKSGEVRSFEGNTLENRMEILRSFPAIRAEITERVDALTVELGEELEEVSKN